MILNKLKPSSIYIFVIAALLVGGSYVWFAQRHNYGPVLQVDSSATRNRQPVQQNNGGTGSQRPLLPSASSPQGKRSLEERAQAMEARAREAYEQVALLSSSEVGRVLLGVLQSAVDDDGSMLNAASGQLVTRGKKGDETAIEAIRTAIEGASGNDREYLTHLLGQIATEDALRSLIEIVETSSKDDRWLRSGALQAIATIGRYDDMKSSPQPLSSLLENYFDAIPKDDLRVVESVANGLATLGTASGVEKLVTFIETVESKGALTPEIITAMGSALDNIDSSSATITPLRTRLLRDATLERKTTVMAGDAITRMLGTMEPDKALEVLLEWSSQAEGSKARDQARVWFSEVSAVESYQMIVNAKERYQFRDPEILEMISEVAIEAQDV